MRRLVLLPVELERGDSSQRYLATGLAVGVSRRLDRLGGLTIRSGAAAAWPTSPGQDTSALGGIGTVALLRVTISRDGDSLDVRALLADSVTHVVRRVLTRRFAATELAEIESNVAAVVAGSVLRVGAPFDPGPSLHAVEPESYRLTILGFHHVLVTDDMAAALASFVRATELDPLNARAWAGLSSVWAARTATDQVSLDEGVARTTAAAERALAIDSTEGTALANLGAVRTFDSRSVTAGMPLIRRAIAFEPSNAEIYMIAGGLNRYAHRWDEARDFTRRAHGLDPLTPRYLEAEGSIEMCAGRPAASEQVFRHLLEQRPASDVARIGLARTLAAQGRYDEALDARRLGISPSTASTLVEAHRDAAARVAYFEAQHAEGRVLLDAFRRSTAGKRVSPLRLMLLQFQSGDSAAGFAALAVGMRDRAHWIYRLPCFPALDEVRGTARYRAMLSEIGTMPTR
jgi:adenylate cyclase